LLELPRGRFAFGELIKYKNSNQYFVYSYLIMSSDITDSLSHFAKIVLYTLMDYN